MSKRLCRLKEERIIAGVCAGVADYFEIDPTIVRIVWLLSAFAGFGILAYLVCWIIMPEQNPSVSADSYPNGNSAADKEKSKQVLGIVLIVVGSIFLIDRFFQWFDLSIIIPAAIIVLGLYILYGARRTKSWQKTFG
mgnify:CR=1 FL=1